MTKPLLATTLVALIATVAFALYARRAAADETSRFERVRSKIAPQLKRQLAAKGLRLGAPVFMRIFKQERQLEVWVGKAGGGRFKLFKSYPICTFSGKPGPKLARGDLQAPEGFYFVPRSSMNPQSSFHLSFDLGYPNAYDRAHGRTGSLLMVHGNCVSIGCYAMTDPLIEEIYTLADAALTGGQEFFRVHCFPFKMTPARMAQAEREGGEWLGFWKNLKPGYDWFERERRPPNVTVRDGKYEFSGG